MTRRGLMWALASGAALALSGCGSLFPTTYRYKMTVEVDTPQGLKTGYAVREIAYTESWPKLPDAPGAMSRQRGEAVAVDLPGGKTLFALLSTDAYQTMQAGFGADSRQVLDAAKADRSVHVMRPLGPKVQDWESGMPLLVRFRDISDPKSVEKVDPDNLAAAFGLGVRMRRITVQMTKEAVTTGIEKRLGWLPTVYDRLRGASFKPEGIPVGNYRRLFSTELGE